MSATKPKNRVAEFLGVLLVGLVFYVLHFFGYFQEFNSSLFFINDPDDAKVYSWNTWHFVHQLSQSKNPFFTDYLFYPGGSGLWMHAYTIWFGVLNLALNNVYLAINLGIAIQLIAAFVGFFYLAKIYIDSTSLALAVAHLSVFNFYILSKVGVHYNLVLIGLLPFIMLLAIRLGDLTTKSIQWHQSTIIKLLILLILGFFVEYYVVFYALAFLVIYLLWVGVVGKWFSNWSWKKSGVLLVVLSAGHVIARLLRITGASEKGAVWGTADIQLLWNKSAINSHGISQVNILNDNKVYVGLVLLFSFALCLYVYYLFYRKDKTAQFFLFGTVVFFMVTFPVIRWGTSDLWYNVTGLIHYLPGIQNIRAPDRFVLMFIVFLTLFITYMVFRYLKDNKRPNYMALVGWFLITTAISAYKIPQMDRVNLPTPSTLLAKLEGEGVLILPFGIRDGYQEAGEFDEDQLLLQQQYHFKMPNGYLSRVKETIWESYKEPLYVHLIALQADTLEVEVDWNAELRNQHYARVFIPHSYSKDHPQLLVLENSLVAKREVDELGTLYSLD